MSQAIEWNPTLCHPFRAVPPKPSPNAVLTYRVVDRTGGTQPPETVTVQPNGIDVTTYSYDLNDKLTSVVQGIQGRGFAFDAFGFLRSENTPEKGFVAYDRYGSLGNLRQKTEGAGNVLSYLYDAAGRMACQFAGAIPLDATCSTPWLEAAIPFTTIPRSHPSSVSLPPTTRKRSPAEM